MPTLHPNVILAQHGAEVLCRIYFLPRMGKLMIDGVQAVVGSTFSVGQMYDGKVVYTHEKEVSSLKTLVEDYFSFALVGPDGNRITSSVPRNPCLNNPEYQFTSNGYFKFIINVITVPIPTRVWPKKWSQIETAENGEVKIKKEDFYYQVDTSVYDTYLSSVPEPISYPQLGWERFPIEYEITGIYDYTNIVQGTKAGIKLNGTNMQVGDTFTNADILDGRISVFGTLLGGGYTRITINARIKGTGKYTRATMIIRVIPLAIPTGSGRITLMECSDWTPIDPTTWQAKCPGSEPRQIRMTVDTIKTTKTIEVTPTSFTYQDVIDGNVSIRHLCPSGSTSIYNVSASISVTMCSQYDKCAVRTIPVIVTAYPLPVVNTRGGSNFPRNGSLAIHGEIPNTAPRMLATAMGSTPDQITWVFDPTATLAFHNTPIIFKFNMTTFTQADINAGRVFASHVPQTTTNTHNHMVFNVTTQAGKTRQGSITLTLAP